MTKRIGLLVLVVALALVGAVNSQTAKAQTVNLTLLGWSSSPSENTRLQQIIDTWNKANPTIQVKLNQVPEFDTTLQKALAGNEPPDVFYVDSSKLPDLAEAKALAPIGDKMSKVDDFIPSLKAAFTYNGTFYCPAKDFSTLALFVNKSMMDKAGIKEGPKTWADLKAAAKAMNTGGVAGISLPNDAARWIAFLYQAGGAFADEKFEKSTINSKEALEALKFYTDFFADKTAQTPKQLGAGWAGEAFFKGKAAMVVEGNWLVPAIKDNAPDLKYEVYELPAGSKGKATMAFTVCYGVAAKGKNTEAATKFVDYITGAEGMKAWTDLGLAMPTRKSLSEGWLKQYPTLKPFLDGAEYARKWQFVPSFANVLDETGKQIGLIFDGSTTPEDALKAIDKLNTEVLALRKK